MGVGLTGLVECEETFRGHRSEHFISYRLFLS